MSDKSIGEKNYEQFARRYAEHVADKSHNAYYERPAMLSLLPDVAGKRVLDAGCGPAILTEILLDKGADVVAFDVTPAFVSIARERVGERATVHQQDITRPYSFAEDGAFDLIVCSLVLDYVEDWGEVFAQFYRVLAAGGVLVFSAGHVLGDYLYLKRRDYNLDYFKTQRFTTDWSGFGEPKPRITSYRRSFAAQINPLLQAGFVLDDIHEPLPTDAFKARDPVRYERLAKQPDFIVVRAHK
jgi:SAM-dependent methyltransferase